MVPDVEGLRPGSLPGRPAWAAVQVARVVLVLVPVLAAVSGLVQAPRWLLRRYHHQCEPALFQPRPFRLLQRGFPLIPLISGRESQCRPYRLQPPVAVRPPLLFPPPI